MSDVETVGGVSFLLVLSAAMFFGSYFAGQIPLVMNLSEVGALNTSSFLTPYN